MKGVVYVYSVIKTTGKMKINSIAVS
jgi:hypothetical protein